MDLNVEGLVDEATRAGLTASESHQLGQLLTEYASPFNTGDTVQGRISWMEHEIPLIPWARPIRQPAGALVLKKRLRWSGR